MNTFESMSHWLMKEEFMGMHTLFAMRKRFFPMLSKFFLGVFESHFLFFRLVEGYLRGEYIPQKSRGIFSNIFATASK